MVKTAEECKQEVESRLDDLKFEYGDDSDMDELQIYDILRDEFQDDEYSQILIDMGIADADLGLEEIDDGSEDSIGGDSNLEDKDKLVSILLNPEKHILFVEKRFKGWDFDNKKFIKKRPYLIPVEEINLIIQILDGLFSAQNLVSKLNNDISGFEDSMNQKVQNIKNRLEDYPDHIVPAKSMTAAIDILLSEIQVVSNAIRSGRLGDLTRDILIGSYNEKSDGEGNKVKSKLDEFFG